jgi:hypothetical protein
LRGVTGDGRPKETFERCHAVSRWIRASSIALSFSGVRVSSPRTKAILAYRRSVRLSWGAAIRPSRRLTTRQLCTHVQTAQADNAIRRQSTNPGRAFAPVAAGAAGFDCATLPGVAREAIFTIFGCMVDGMAKLLFDLQTWRHLMGFAKPIDASAFTN